MIDINIQDVAKKAGVSVATVSRVLNNSDRVSEATAKLVNNAISELKYHPNLVGRNLRRKESRLLLIITNSVVNTFFAKIIKGIEDKASENGYGTMICTTDNTPKKIEGFLDLLNARIADGAILLSIGLDDNLSKKAAAINKIHPIIQCCEFEEGSDLSHISIDDFKAGCDATMYLLSLGKKRILHISANNKLRSTKMRLEGYKKALSEANIPFSSELVVHGNYGYRNSMKLMAEFLKKDIPFDAIFANSDRMAAGAMRVLTERGVEIPRQVAVIGFDNTEVCYMVKPGITSVSQPQYELGARAFDMFLEQISRNNEKEEQYLDYELIKRESTNI